MDSYFLSSPLDVQTTAVIIDVILSTTFDTIVLPSNKYVKPTFQHLHASPHAQQLHKQLICLSSNAQQSTFRPQIPFATASYYTFPPTYMYVPSTMYLVAKAPFPLEEDFNSAASSSESVLFTANLHDPFPSAPSYDSKFFTVIDSIAF